MSFDYARASATASRLIANFGAPAVLRKAGAVTGPAYDPTLGTPTFSQITAVDLDRAIRDREGVMVGESRRTLYVAAQGTAPAKGDRVKLGAFAAGMSDAAFSDAHEIIEVRTLAPAGVAVMYEVDLAR